MNEVRNAKYKKAVQTAVYVPHFLSWVIVGGIFTTLLSPNTGIVNNVRQMMGLDSVYYMASEKPVSYTHLDVYKRQEAAGAVLAEIKRCFAEQMLRVIGPASPYVGKIKDQYYQMLYLKHRDISLLIAVRRHLEQYLECTDYQKDVMIQYDFR